MLTALINIDIKGLALFNFISDFSVTSKSRCRAKRILDKLHINHLSFLHLSTDRKQALVRLSSDSSSVSEAAKDGNIVSRAEYFLDLECLVGPYCVDSCKGAVDGGWSFSIADAGVRHDLLEFGVQNA